MNLLEKIVDFSKLRGYLASEIVVFGLQLLAWDKLSREMKIPDNLYINNFPRERHAENFIKDVFDTLYRSNILEKNAPAFESDAKNLSRLRSEDIQQLLDLVSFAPNTEYLSFDETIDACINAEAHRGGFWNFLPTELTELMLNLSDLQGSDRIYCPFDGSLRLALKANYISSDVSAEVGTHSPFPYLLNILFDRNINVREGNPVRDIPKFVEGEKLILFDVALANPPFGMRYPKNDLIFFMDMFNRFPEVTLSGDVLQIRHILAQTKRRAVVVVADGLLFRTTAGEKEFKKNIVESGILKAVIGLPPGLLTYAGISLSIIVLDKENSSDSILFINANSEHFFEKRKGTEGSGLGKRKLINTKKISSMFRNTTSDFSRLVTKAECAENDYNLLAQRYVFDDSTNQLDDVINNADTQLGNLVELIRPQTLKDYVAEEGEKYFEVSVSDIGFDGIVRRPRKEFFGESLSLGKLNQQLLFPEDILLTIKGSTGKVGLIPIDLTEKWVANQSLLVLRMRYNKYFSSPIVLFRFLTSPIGQALLQRLVGGTSVPMIQTKDIKMLPVIVPSKKEQAAIIKDHEQIVSIYEEVSELQAKAEQIAKKHWSLD